MLIGDRWVEAVIGHIAGGDVVEDPPLLEKEVIEERSDTSKIRPVSLEGAAARRPRLRAKEEPGEDPRGGAARARRVAVETARQRDALAKLRVHGGPEEAAARRSRPRRRLEGEVDAEVACSKAAMAAERTRLAARNAAVMAAVPTPPGSAGQRPGRGGRCCDHSVEPRGAERRGAPRTTRGTWTGRGRSCGGRRA